MAYIDQGRKDAHECVLLLHGEPSWSFLYRKVAAKLAESDIRVVIPDLPGFGRSDKPGRTTDFSYARMVAWVGELVFGVLRLGFPQKITLVCQDWGGLIGLRLVAASPESFGRVVTANTFLPTGMGGMPEVFKRWVEFSQTARDLPVGAIVAGGCSKALPDDVIAAYDAPYDTEADPEGLDAKAGARALPALVPTSPSSAAFKANRRAWGVLARFKRPWLCAFSDEDPITRGADAVFTRLVPGTSAKGVRHVVLKGAGHFLQEDAGGMLGEAVLDFVRATRADPDAPLLAGPEAGRSCRRAEAELYGAGARDSAL